MENRKVAGMSKKDNGVLYIKYKDDKEAKNGRGIAVHLYQDVKHYGFLAEGINLLKIELDDINREAVYIPMSNMSKKMLNALMNL